MTKDKEDRNLDFENTIVRLGRLKKIAFFPYFIIRAIIDRIIGTGHIDDRANDIYQDEMKGHNKRR
jgi:hypothetical protein